MLKISFSEIDRAAEPLRKAWRFRSEGYFPNDFDWNSFIWAWLNITFWRKAHSYPLSQMRKAIKDILINKYPNILLSQRLKRMPSIIEKLINEPKMRLSQMYDIGGCRIVVKNMKELEDVVNLLKRLKNTYSLQVIKNYIEEPKFSGYRGVHQIYKFKGTKIDIYDNTKIEVQIRTNMQHAWATAVESFEALMQTNFKRGKGRSEWLRFFALMGSVGAETENLSYTPMTGTNLNDIINEIKTLNDRHKIYDQLKKLQLLPFRQLSNNPDGHYFLIISDFEKQRISIKGFNEKNLIDAANEYEKAELKWQNDNSKYIVLVSVDSFKDLTKAFPNFWGKAEIFMEQVDKIFKLIKWGN